MNTVHLTIPSFPGRASKRLPAPAGRKRKHANVPPVDQAQTPAVQLGPLDSSVLSEAIPAFFIGRDRAGFWVARDAKGRTGGLFLLKNSALSFAHAQGGPAGCATIFPSERFELDLKNDGNPFASHLAPLVRLWRSMSNRIGKLFETMAAHIRQ